MLLRRVTEIATFEVDALQEHMITPEAQIEVVAMLESEVAANNTLAQAQLSRCLLRGILVPRNPVRALALAQASASAGCAWGHFALGNCLYTGAAGSATPEANRAVAQACFESAQALPCAMHNLALCLWRDGADLARAKALFSAAAIAGHRAAKLNLGYMLLEARDHAGALEHFSALHAEDPSDVAVISLLADALVQTDDVGRAVPMYQLGHELGVVRCTVMMALCFLSGVTDATDAEILAQDRAKSAALMWNAATRGSVFAQDRLGVAWGGQFWRRARQPYFPPRAGPAAATLMLCTRRGARHPLGDHFALPVELCLIILEMTRWRDWFVPPLLPHGASVQLAHHADQCDVGGDEYC